MFLSVPGRCWKVWKLTQQHEDQFEKQTASVPGIMVADQVVCVIEKTAPADEKDWCIGFHSWAATAGLSVDTPSKEAFSLAAWRSPQRPSTPREVWKSCREVCLGRMNHTDQQSAMSALWFVMVVRTFTSVFSS